MTKYWREFSVLGLCVFLTGCSGYHAVAIRGAIGTGANAIDESEGLVGKSAIITLSTGHQERGEVLNITIQTITLGKASNYGYEEAEFPIDEIELIEVLQSSRVESILGGVIGAGIFAAIVVFIGLSQSGGIGGT